SASLAGFSAGAVGCSFAGEAVGAPVSAGVVSFASVLFAFSVVVGLGAALFCLSDRAVRADGWAAVAELSNEPDSSLRRSFGLMCGDARRLGDWRPAADELLALLFGDVRGTPAGAETSSWRLAVRRALAPFVL